MVFGHKFLIMSDFVTKALVCYAEIVQYFAKYENIHLGHRFEKDGRIPVISFSVIIVSESELNTWIGTVNTI